MTQPTRQMVENKREAKKRTRARLDGVPAREWRLPDFKAPSARRQHFPRIQPLLGIEKNLETSDVVERILREKLAHEFILLHADAMLSRDRAAGVDAIFQNLLARGFGALEFARHVVVEEDDRVQVAIARVENIADLEVVLFRHLSDEAQRGRDL